MKTMHTELKASACEVEQGPRNKRIEREAIGPLFDVMRGFVPKDGDDYVKIVSVHVKPGGWIGEHRHSEHTVLYYLNSAGIPVVVEGRHYLPEAGDIVYLPPNTPHAVPKNTSSEVRKSLAILVEA